MSFEELRRRKAQEEEVDRRKQEAELLKKEEAERKRERDLAIQEDKWRIQDEHRERFNSMVRGVLQELQEVAYPHLKIHSHGWEIFEDSSWTPEGFDGSTGDPQPYSREYIEIKLEFDENSSPTNFLCIRTCYDYKYSARVEAIATLDRASLVRELTKLQLLTEEEIWSRKQEDIKRKKKEEQRKRGLLGKLFG